jgi:hypothetical protein
VQFKKREKNMPKKSSSNNFNAAAPKDGDLLRNITHARKCVEFSVSLLELLPAVAAVRKACAILESRVGFIPSGIDALEKAIKKDNADLGKAIENDRTLYPAINARHAEEAALYTQKKASEAFGFLGSLLDVDDEGMFVLAKMDNKHRLKICQRAKKSLKGAVLLELRLNRQVPQKAPSAQAKK